VTVAGDEQPGLFEDEGAGPEPGDPYTDDPGGAAAVRGAAGRDDSDQNQGPPGG
jgi:hypothetical protein